MRRLLLDVAEEFAGAPPVERAAARLHEARRLDNDVADVDAALRTAEDSLRFNPRVKEGLLHRIVLRTGLDTLEICAVVLRVLTRTLTDLAKRRDGEELLPGPAALALQETAQHTADAFVSYAVLVTAPGSEDAEAAETRLAGELRAARACRDSTADLLLALALRDPGSWQLYGALLAEIDRVLDEMDPTTGAGVSWRSSTVTPGTAATGCAAWRPGPAARLGRADRPPPSPQVEPHQNPGMPREHRGGVGGVGEPGALEVLPQPGVRHREVDPGVAVVERIRLDHRCAVDAGEVDRAGDQRVRDARLAVTGPHPDAPQ